VTFTANRQAFVDDCEQFFPLSMHQLTLSPLNRKTSAIVAPV